MKITSLFLKNNRIQVFIDEKYFFSCTQNFMVQEKLYIGLELSQEELDKLKRKAEQSILEYKMIEYATRSRYSAKELARKVDNYAFKKFGFVVDEKIMQDFIKKLASLHLYNSKELTRRWIENYIFKKKSKTYIRAKLLAKGFDKSEIEEELNKVKDEPFADNLQTLIEKKKIELERKKLDKFEIKRKLIEFGLRKGYEYGEIKKVI